MSASIVCANCVLRAPAPGDATSLARHANDRDIWINLRDLFPHPYAIEDAQRWIARVADQQPRINFIIDVGGEACGGIGFLPGTDIESCTAEVGYWLGKAYWNRGIATAALRAVSDYAFEELRLQRIFATPIVWNPRSFRVLEKAGFERETTLRHACIKDGRLADMALYAKTFFLVRPMREDDVDGTLALFDEVVAEGRWIGTQPGFDRRRKSDGWRATMRDGALPLFVAEAGGRVVGQAGLHHDEEFGLVIGMLVASRYRGRRIGAELLERVTQWARERGESRLRLQVFAHNERAIALYRKAGFLEEPRNLRQVARKNGEVWDAIAMSRELPGEG